MPAEFHPAVANWFDRTFDAPTPAQRAAWPEIIAQRHVLIAAPTGSGKTLAAFLAVIDELVVTGRPIHLSELMRLLDVRNIAIPGAGTQANLIAHLRRDPRLVRPSRGMYGLAAWGLENMAPTQRTVRKKRFRVTAHK